MQYMLVGLCAPAVLVLHGCTKKEKKERPHQELPAEEPKKPGKFFIFQISFLNSK